MGSACCGTHALAQLRDRPADAQVTHAEPPLLPWRADRKERIAARLKRLRQRAADGIVGNVASFYLPYAEEAISAGPDLRIICLRRPREEVVASFCRWLDTVAPLPTNHWARQPRPAWYHDPIWTRIYPQYETQDRAEAIRRYWDEYYQRAESLARKYPEQIRVFEMDRVLNHESGQRELWAFIGVAEQSQVLTVGRRTRQSEHARLHPRREILAASTDPGDPKRCVILVPYTGQIVPDCERVLTELERRGYTVWQIRGYSAIDQGRNQMATDALAQGFEETIWIDADIACDAAAVEQLRQHDEPIVCGLYPQEGRRALACHVIEGTQQLVFGEQGGLTEVRYAGTGFMRIRREVYLEMQRRRELPVCNERFGQTMVPFFQPSVQPIDEGAWYLAEDYSFCERARCCGYRIAADTSIRLWHVGQYAYSWEDAGLERRRFGSFVYHLT